MVEGVALVDWACNNRVASGGTEANPGSERKVRLFMQVGYARKERTRRRE
jgi:hypothetical protein